MLSRLVAIGVLTAALGIASQAQAQTAACARLVAQLDAVERAATAGPARLAQYENAIERQRGEINRTVDYAAAIGCDGDPSVQQCASLLANIERMENNLLKLQEEASRIAANASATGSAERARIIALLQQQQCAGFEAPAGGGQRAASIFDGLFGDEAVDPAITDPNAAVPLDGAVPDDPFATAVRTICVRKCDGYYFPISFASTPATFPAQEQACRALCPAGEVELFAYSPMTQTPEEAVSVVTGLVLRDMPNAFRYRQSYDPNCMCKKPGESWAQALAPAEAMLSGEAGDVIVTEEQSRAMAQPKPADKGDKPAAKREKQAKPKADVAEPLPLDEIFDSLQLDGATTVQPQ